MGGLGTIAAAFALTVSTCAAVAQTSLSFDESRQLRSGTPLEAPNCRRQGSLLVSVGQHLLRVPRNILSLVGTNTLASSIPCTEERVDGRIVGLSVSRTMAGDAFYEDWLLNVRLPTSMEIGEAGYLRTSTADEFQRLKEGGWPSKQDAGVETVMTKSSVYYRLERPAEPLFISCSTRKLLHGGHACRTAYRRGDYGVRYRFSDSHIPQSEWIKMDARFQRFLQKLESAASTAPTGQVPH